MSGPSVYSYDSSLDPERFIDDINGRAFNSLNKAYCLPSDEIEWDRLDKQHAALRIAFGGLTPCDALVDAILTPARRRKRRVLDIGCGTGIWALQMARKFPHIRVCGIDVAPVPIPTAEIPPNLRFEIDDVDYGLAHFYNKYDLVHVRCVGTGVRDYTRMLDEVEKCLKPGGILIFLDADLRILTLDQLHPVHFPGQHGQISWFRKILYETIEASKIAGSSWEATSELLDKGLFERPMCDPETAVGGAVILPIGPWAMGQDLEETQMLQWLGILMRHVFTNVHKGYHRILLDHGISQAMLDEWSARADEELNSPDSKMWVRFKFCWARKRAGPGQPAPPLPSPTANETFTASPGSDASTFDSQPTYESSQLYYRYRTYYRTQVEMMYEAIRRNRADVPLPPFELRGAWERRRLYQPPH